MYEKFKFERVALSAIKLDDRNPRIVTQEKLATEDAIIAYLFEHEGLAAFIKLVAAEGRNPGAERPYVVKDGKSYVVVEGNTRVAAYKLLTGQRKPADPFMAAVPMVSEAVRDELVSVDVAIAPNRDALMTIMARAHFGRGDKSKWGYLGSRKAVHDDWKSGKSIGQLANVFGRTQGGIRDLLLEYFLYLETLKLDWTDAERDVLLRPDIEFNPPVRFLQTTGHKQLVGIELDKVNLAVKFTALDGAMKLKHLVRRTVIEENGPSATASYDQVFGDYVDPTIADAAPSSNDDADKQTKSDDKEGTPDGGAVDPIEPVDPPAPTLKPGTLFAYPVKRHDLTLSKLMDEAKKLNTKTYPAAGSALLRSIIEVLLKLIIDDKGVNHTGQLLDIEGALNLAIGKCGLPIADVQVLKEFKKNHLSYMNLSTHATVVPNHTKLMYARDTIDAFVKRNV